MATQPNNRRSSSDSALTKTAHGVVAQRRADPLRLVRSKPRAVLGLAQSMASYHPAAQQRASASEPALVSAGQRTSAAKRSRAFVKQKPSEITILLVTQPGLLADGLARSLAQ